MRYRLILIAILIFQFLFCKAQNKALSLDKGLTDRVTNERSRFCKNQTSNSSRELNSSAVLIEKQNIDCPLKRDEIIITANHNGESTVRVLHEMVQFIPMIL